MNSIIGSDYPSKLYYSISEVAKITGVKAHVLRYWETEFSTLHPRKTRTGSRRYRKIDIEEILAIKTLLYDEGFKIAGARKMRRQSKKEARTPEAQAGPQMNLGFTGVDHEKRQELVKEELKEILVMIRQLGSQSSESTPAKGLKKMKGKA